MASDKYVLGINGGVRPGYQDISSVLMKNGEVIAAVEEERLNRIKHTSGQLPVLSVYEVLRIAQINIQDIALVAFHGSTWQSSIDEVLKSHFKNYFGYCPPIKRYHHHDCHAASTFYPSGLEQALVITVDGSGDGISTQIAIGRDRQLQVLHRYERPQSLGMFYSMFTQFCGFTRDADEYKLMGLAAYGDASAFDLSNILRISDSGYEFNEQYMVDVLPGQPSPSRYEMLYSNQLTEALGLKRRTEKSIPDKYKNLAAAVQLQLENAMTKLVSYYVRQTGIKHVCMAGGVALNCLANRKIEALDEVNKLFIQPASSDAGISLGAAYLGSLELGIDTFPKQQNTFLGGAFSNDEILDTLKKCGANFSLLENEIDEAATLLANGKVLGWFQGRMEFGPRALGNRSILANPSKPNIKETVNQKVKFREGFRPFGASVLEEDFHLYFEAKCLDAPYMTKVFLVKPEFRDLLAGVTHADGTCRVQTVNRNQNEKYYDLLRSFKMHTGFGVLLNTSFNLSHEPIVNTPREAVAAFSASGIDALFIGNAYCI